MRYHRAVRFDERFIDEIKSRLRPSDLIGKTVKLRKQGREFVGLSPFTKEKTPSFYVNDEKGQFFDFSSGKTGDLITFLQETQRLSFTEAVEQLAAEAGVALPAVDPRAVEQEKVRQGLSEWLELAAQWFEGELRRPAGRDARAYLEKRGLPEADWARFRLGFSPPGRTALKDYLITKGARPGELIEAGLLIAPEDGGAPYDRFREDRLRMMRAARFATTLGFDLDPQTWRAVCENAPHIHEVSAERIREELMKILLSPRRVRGFDLLDEGGLLREILPEIETLKGCAQPPQFHPEGDVFVHTRLMLSLLPAEVSGPLVLAVLFHDLGKPPTFAVDLDGRIRFNGHEKISAEMTEVIMTRLRFSRAEIDATVAAVANHMAFKDVQQMRVAKLKRFLARPHIDDELELHRVDCTSSHGLLDNYHFLQAKRAEFASAPLIPPPLVTGRDLIALGLKPSPHFAGILEAVENRQLEGTLTTRDEALAWVKAEWPQ